MRVENAESRLRIPRENPLVQRNRLLRDMDSRIALRPLRTMPEDLRVLAAEGSPGIFAHRHREIFRDVALVPDQEAPGRRQGEIVPAPDNLIARDAEELLEILPARSHVPRVDFFPNRAAHFPPVLLTDGVSVKPPSEPARILLSLSLHEQTVNGRSRTADPRPPDRTHCQAASAYSPCSPRES